MTPAWENRLRRWTEAGLLDAAAAERIRAFEAAAAGQQVGVTDERSKGTEKK